MARGAALNDDPAGLEEWRSLANAGTYEVSGDLIRNEQSLHFATCIACIEGPSEERSSTDVKTTRGALVE
jgi:hypothetical protein